MSDNVLGANDTPWTNHMQTFGFVEINYLGIHEDHGENKMQEGRLGVWGETQL